MKIDQRWRDELTPRQESPITETELLKIWSEGLYKEPYVARMHMVDGLTAAEN